MLEEGRPGSLAGKVAVVTGAGRGIGRAHAMVLARLGAQVVVNDLGVASDGSGYDPEPAARVVAAISHSGGAAISDATDIGSLNGGGSLIRRAVEAFGRVDILINNAGIAAGGGTIDHPVESEIDRHLDVHLKGPLGTMAAALPIMTAQRWGRIINTVSEVALDPRFASGGTFAYGLAKAALWSATLAAARAGAPYGVTVNAISPGARTRMSERHLSAASRDPSSDLDLDPRHVAQVAAWLASDGAGDVNGRILHAAGGHVREYLTYRSQRTDLVARLRAALPPRIEGGGN